MSPRLFDIQQDGDVTIVRIERPPVNAIDLELASAGGELLEELAAETRGAVVLTGSAQSFSAGLDIKLVPTLDKEQQRAMHTAVNRLLGGWALLPRPLVTAVNGHAIAGGLILALCGDWRVVGPHGQFGLTEVKVGVPYPPAAIAIVRSELAPPVARRYALGAELIDSATAVAAGMFDELVDEADVLDRALTAARRLAPLAGPAYAQTKRALRAQVVRALEPGAVSDGSWLGDDAGARTRDVLDR